MAARIRVLIRPVSTSGEHRCQVRLLIPGVDVEPHELIGREAHGRLVVTREPATTGIRAPGEIAGILGRLEARDYSADDVNTLAVHLFECLLGERLWKETCKAAPDLVELAIECPEENWVAGRLPWEMMRSATSFLAAMDRPRIGITHLVCSAPPHPASSSGCGGPRFLRIEPTILFVIGARLDEDPQVRAGAEYVCTIRRIRERGLAVHQQVLLEARPSDLKDAIARHHPSIVHFIGHGGVDPVDGRGYIELLPDDPKESERARIKGEQLAALLSDGDYCPKVLVLGACSTGHAPPVSSASSEGGRGGRPTAGATRGAEQVRWEFAPPLAAECVRRGIPVVVGMGGEIANGACRLFARRFYEALLQGQCVVTATTEGRRAGFELAESPESSVDWAYPALFLSSEMNTAVELVGADCIARRDALARKYAPDRNLTFCDRLEFLNHYRQLVRPPAAGARVLAVGVTRDDGEPGGARYGKTWLLEELAAQAIRDGHLACLVDMPRTEDPPRDALSLAQRILLAANETWEHFELPWPDLQVPRLAGGLPLAPAIQDMLRLNPDPRKVAARALHADLETIGAAWREHSPHGYVMVLIDDVHRLGTTAATLLDYFTGPDGLASSREPVPLVVTYSSRRGPECKPALDAVTTFVQQGTHGCLHADLGPFNPPTVHELAYRQHLIGQPQPLVLGTSLRAREESGTLFAALHDATMNGIPSMLIGHTWGVVMRLAFNQGLLVLANDDEVLGQLSGGLP